MPVKKRLFHPYKKHKVTHSPKIAELKCYALNYTHSLHLKNYSPNIVTWRKQKKKKLKKRELR